MRVSVVMPAFHAEPTIGAAISSVLGQTYRDLELVVVDDGSTDATAAIAAAYPEPVRVVSQENAGVAAARNRGIAEARGELIAFCDADDVFLPGHLEALVDIFDRDGGGIATSNCYWLFPGGIHPSRTRYKGRFPRPARQRLAILEQNFVSTMSLFPKALVEEIGPFDRSARSPRTGTSGCGRSSPATAWRCSRGRSRSTAGVRGLSAAPARWTTTSRPSCAARPSGTISPTRSALTWSGGSRAPARGARAQGDEALRAKRYRDAARATRAPPASVRASRACSGRPARCGSRRG